MKLESGGISVIETLERAQELLMAMLPVALPDDLPLRYVQRSEERVTIQSAPSRWIFPRTSWPSTTALAQSESAVQVLGDAQLRTIARELVKSVRENATIDWSLRASVRAGIKLKIKKILRKHKYPPDASESATEQVLEQAELLCQAVA